MRADAALTSATLAGIGGLHVAWGLGSTWPFADGAQLADRVVGSAAVPGPGPCFAVAAALGTAAALVAGRPARAPRLRAVGCLGVASVLGARAVLGFAGRSDLVSPGSASPTFRRLDRRAFSPLCTALAVGAARAARA